MGEKKSIQEGVSFFLIITDIFHSIFISIQNLSDAHGVRHASVGFTTLDASPHVLLPDSELHQLIREIVRIVSSENRILF